MILRALTILLACQLVGEVVHVASGVPVPGPVIGMAILFCGLLVRGKVDGGVERTAGGLLDNLSLLFVPAGVGVMVHLPRLADEGAAVAVALIGSAVVTIAVTALVMRRLLRLKGGDKGP